MNTESQGGEGNRQKDPEHDGPVHGTSQGQEPQPTEKPSQAEGDRETIDQDLQSKDSQTQK